MATANVKIPVQGNVKFGLKALFHPTPEQAKIVARTVLYGAGIITGVLNLISEVPQPVKDTVNRYATEVVSIVYFLCHMFGVTVEGPQNANEGQAD